MATFESLVSRHSQRLPVCQHRRGLGTHRHQDWKLEKGGSPIHRVPHADQRPCTSVTLLVGMNAGQADNQDGKEAHKGEGSG